MIFSEGGIWSDDCEHLADIETRQSNVSTRMARKESMPKVSSLNEALPVLHRVFVTLLVDWNEELGNVGDELIALGLPKNVHTHLQMLDQNLLKKCGEGWREISNYKINTNMLVLTIGTAAALTRNESMRLN